MANISYIYLESANVWIVDAVENCTYMFSAGAIFIAVSCYLLVPFFVDDLVRWAFLWWTVDIG